MRFNLLFLLSLISYSSCVSTNSNYKTNKEIYTIKYESFLEKNNTTKVHSANVNYTIEFNKISKKYIYKQYQPQKTVLLTYSEHKKASLKTNECKFIIYGDDGRIMQEGNYINNQKVDFWQDFDEKGNYINDQRHGIWHKFRVDSLGNLTDTISIKKYENSVLIHEEHIDSSDIVTLAYLPNCEKEIPEDRIECTEINLLKALYSNIVYSTYARKTGIEGLTYTNFTIDKTGQITDINVIRSICNQMEEEIIRVIKQLPKFKPALLDGEKTSIRYNVPIRFKLQY